ncbi:MAG: fatty acid desaturase, partial [Xanthomonadales bacterium]|nr:fatty acid desaturase [Xanthomonadales bacterium]
ALAGDRQVIEGWLHHGAGLLLVVPLVFAMEVPLWAYALFAAYPGYSLIMVRSFIEHRADEDPKKRSA